MNGATGVVEAMVKEWIDGYRRKDGIANVDRTGRLGEVARIGAEDVSCRIEGNSN